MQEFTLSNLTEPVGRRPEVPIPCNHLDDCANHSRTNSTPTVRIAIASDADIVVARQQGKALAKAMSFSATDMAFIATAISELARALLSHTARGEIWMHPVDEPRRAGVVIVAHDPIGCVTLSDRGNGSSSDLALPAVFRLVDEFHIGPDAGQGTTITATKWCRRR